MNIFIILLIAVVIIMVIFYLLKLPTPIRCIEP